MSYLFLRDGIVYGQAELSGTLAGESFQTTDEEISEVFGKISEGYDAVYNEGAIEYILNPKLVSSLKSRSRELFKIARSDLISKLTVTTENNNTFDGNEVAQARMDRFSSNLQKGLEKGLIVVTDPAYWVLADNTKLDTTVSGLISELDEACFLAGLEQSKLWLQA